LGDRIQSRSLKKLERSQEEVEEVEENQEEPVQEIWTVQWQIGWMEGFKVTWHLLLPLEAAGSFSGECRDSVCPKILHLERWLSLSSLS